MKGVNNKSKGLLCVTLTAIMVFAVFTAGIGIVPAGADPGPTRSVVPDSVAPGGEVNVTIVFTTLCDFTYLFIRDYVPLGWDVTDMRVNEDANETLFLTEFNATSGIVLFFWVPINSGIDVTAEYTLHVPPGVEPGAYPLAGELVGWSEDIGSWNDTIPEGTVMVELPYGVNLSVDEEEKTTDANVNATYYITVENTGAIADTYGLSVTSTGADFAKLNKTSVSLGAGESEVVELNVSASSSGSYDTTVSAASAHASDEITVTTNVSAVYGVDLKVEGGDYADKTVEPNETASYTLTVENTGSDSDSYELTVNNISNADIAVLDQYAVPNLAAGASADVVLNVSDSEEGEYIVNVTATSQGNASVSGRVMTKTTVSTPSVQYDIPLVEGWNMFGVPLNVSDWTLPAVLTSIDGKYTYISYYNATSEEMEYYDPLDPAGSTLKALEQGAGYLISMSEDAIASFEGRKLMGLERSLKADWNMFSIPYGVVDETLPAVLTSIDGKYTYISYYNATSEEMEYYDPLDPVGSTLKALEPGAGYLISMTEDAVFIPDMGL